jgi:branched-chain amino acid aminotransferase
MAEANYILMDGKAVAFSEAKIHVLSPAVAYAAMVFEGIRGYWNDECAEMFLFRLDEHLLRLRESIRTMRYDADFCLADLRRQVIELIRINDFRKTIHLRVIAAITGVPPTITTSSPVSFIVTAGVYPMKDWAHTGVAVGVSSWQRVHESSNPPRVKASANYGNGRLAALQAKIDGYDTPLMLTREGKVSEAPTATLVMRRRGKLVTPPVTDSILEGITRDTVIELAADVLGESVVERSIDRTELYSAEEIFLCGSGWEVVPVTSVDRIPVGNGTPGALTGRIQAVYSDVVHGRCEEYRNWLTPVWQD